MPSKDLNSVIVFNYIYFIFHEICSYYRSVKYELNFNYIESPVPLEEKKGTPLPPIGDKIEEEPTKSDEVSSTAKATPKDHGIPDVPIVFIMGKNCITKSLLFHFHHFFVRYFLVMLVLQSFVSTYYIL